MTFKGGLEVLLKSLKQWLYIVNILPGIHVSWRRWILEIWETLICIFLINFIFKKMFLILWRGTLRSKIIFHLFIFRCARGHLFHWVAARRAGWRRSDRLHYPVPRILGRTLATDEYLSRPCAHWLRPLTVIFPLFLPRYITETICFHYNVEHLHVK